MLYGDNIEFVVFLSRVYSYNGLFENPKPVNFIFVIN